MKIPTRMMSFAVSEAAKRSTVRKNLPSLAGGATPPISKGWIVFDFGKSSIEATEFVSDTLDRGTNIRPEPFFAAAGNEPRMVHAIVNRAIGHVFAGALDQQINDLELGHGEIDIAVVPIGAADIGAQQELAAIDGLVTFGHGGGR